MQTASLGSQGPDLSVIGFGAWEAGAGSEWGKAPPEEHVVEAIRTAVDAGMNWIDTAEVYGDGRSEEVVARALSGSRDDVLIATKVAPSPEGSGFRPDEVRAACEGSLRRLGIERIDLYQLHWEDESGVPVEETWGAMTSLVGEGKVGWIGVSNFDRDLIERCRAIRHVDSLQQEFSMLVPDDRELIRWCGEIGTGVLSYGPLGYGMLTGAITADTTFDESDFRSGNTGSSLYERIFAPGEALERSLGVVQGMRPIAERIGVTLAQLALAWNRHQPGVTSAIAGSRDARHVAENAAAGDVELDAATLAELDALVPAVAP
jgi:aryl-alcohol dehydrogenase-like predicted oxidoreductase